MRAQSSSRGMVVPTAPPAPATAPPAPPSTPAPQPTPRPTATPQAFSAADQQQMELARYAFAQRHDCAAAASALDAVSANGRKTIAWLDIRARVYDCAARAAPSASAAVAAYDNAIALWTRLTSDAQRCGRCPRPRRRPLRARPSLARPPHAKRPQLRRSATAGRGAAAAQVAAQQQAAAAARRTIGSSARSRSSRSPPAALPMVSPRAPTAPSGSPSMRQDRAASTPGGALSEFPWRSQQSLVSPRVRMAPSVHRACQRQDRAHHAGRRALGVPARRRQRSQWYRRGPRRRPLVHRVRPDKIGRITPGGALSEFPLAAGSGPIGIAAGPDGALWFTEYRRQQDRAHHAGRRALGVPARRRQRSQWDIAAGPDGALWFTEYGGNKIGRITPGGALSEFPLAAGSHPYGIAAGPDGALWFTEYSGDKIGRITPGGALSEFPLAAGSLPRVSSRAPTARSGSPRVAATRSGASRPEIRLESGDNRALSPRAPSRVLQGCRSRRSLTMAFGPCSGAAK